MSMIERQFTRPVVTERQAPPWIVEAVSHAGGRERDAAIAQKLGVTVLQVRAARAELRRRAA